MEPSKENIRSCKNLVERFQSLRFYNTLTELSVSIITEAIMNACRDRDQAEQLVNAWIAEHSEYPTAADINQMARELNRNQSGVVTLPPPCHYCREIPGYIRIEQTLTIGVFAGETRPALAVCHCPRGRALREAALRENRERPSSPDFAHIGDLL